MNNPDTDFLEAEERADLDKRFDYHRPPNELIASAHALCRESVKAAALVACSIVPPGRERSVMLTKLEEAMLWANAGIARNPSGVDTAALRHFAVMEAHDEEQ